MWRFKRGDGSEVCRALQLAPGGKVVNHEHPNETSWRVDGDQLLFLAADGSPSTRFDGFDEGGGVLRLLGSFTLAGRPPERHILESWPPYDPAPVPIAFHARLEVARPPARLVVTINGLAGLFDGNERDTPFEMMSLAPSLGANSARVAELVTRRGWYADKLHDVVAAIDGAVGRGTRKIVVVGTSAGGFGAVLIADLLARMHPAKRVCSIAINAQTSLLHAHLQRMWETAPARAMAVWIEPGARAACDPDLLDLRAVIERPGGSAEHVFLYDRANVAESFYAERMGDLPRCRLVGQPLGLRHGEGCDAFYRSGQVRRLAEEFFG